MCWKYPGRRHPPRSRRRGLRLTAIVTRAIARKSHMPRYGFFLLPPVFTLGILTGERARGLRAYNMIIYTGREPCKRSSVRPAESNYDGSFGPPVPSYYRYNVNLIEKKKYDNTVVFPDRLWSDLRECHRRWMQRRPSANDETYVNTYPVSNRHKISNLKYVSSNREFQVERAQINSTTFFKLDIGTPVWQTFNQNICLTYTYIKYLISWWYWIINYKKTHRKNHNYYFF